MNNDADMNMESEKKNRKCETKSSLGFNEEIGQKIAE